MVWPFLASLRDLLMADRVASSLLCEAGAKASLSLLASHFLFFVERELTIDQSPSNDMVAFIAQRYKIINN